MFCVGLVGVVCLGYGVVVGCYGKNVCVVFVWLLLDILWWWWGCVYVFSCIGFG